METKFTKGDWKCDNSIIYVDNDHLTSDDDEFIEGNIICVAPERVLYPESYKNWEFNAKLMAAAPKMYEACLLAKAIYQSIGLNENSRIGGEAYRGLLAALKKATE